MLIKQNAKIRIFFVPLHSQTNKKMDLSSSTLSQAVDALASLPGIGKRSALRFALHLLKQPPEEVLHLSESLHRLATDIHYCSICHSVSDSDLCPICADLRRDCATICVVENIQDVMAIENTQQYHGLYHVLGGLISPMDGIGPADLEIESLVKRVGDNSVKEVILALSSTMEGDTTNFYVFRRLAPTGVAVSMIARGIAVGNELEYTDEVTLGRSILNRTPFEG